MNNEFLPADYSVPEKAGNYMKFRKGVNKFRILTSPVMGYEGWGVKDGKRYPYRTDMNTPLDISKIEDPEKIKHFWAMVVWNYNDSRIQILEITQKMIQKALKALATDEDWGTPVNRYDIVVTRTGEGMETEYQFTPKPATPTDPAITEAFKATSINLNALFSGGDPFEKSYTERLAGIEVIIDDAEKYFDNIDDAERYFDNRETDPGHAPAVDFRKLDPEYKG